MKRITFLFLLMTCIFGTLMAQDVTYEQAFPNLTFDVPVEIQNADDGSNRLFVVEQSGKIKVFQNNGQTTTQQTFLDISNEVSFVSGLEIGLLGLAFHPNYNQNGYFYVYYTRRSSLPGIVVEIVLARYQVSSGNPNQANTSSRLEIFSFDKNQNNNNHNGGKIGFGPDGYLYVSMGDGGGAGDPQGNSQNLNNIFGSILRIDVDVNGNNPLESNPDLPNGNYEIPSDNPLANQGGLDELYAWGIRNTWKFSWDTQNNRMWGADVGQGNYEEVNIIQNGGNYGWNRFEANDSYNSSTGLATSPDIKPVFNYNHSNGDVSITGGYVYRGSSTNSDIQGKYIYGDFVTGRVWALDYNSNSDSATSNLLFRAEGRMISSFGLDEDGEIYFADYTSGKIYQINGGDVTPPPPPPGPTKVAVDGVGVWRALENGTNGTVEAIVTSGEDTYVAGNFSNAGDSAANNIARYNKESGWENLGNGANGPVRALALADDGRLYAGGSFTSIGGVSAQNVAVWNGASWSALGSGTNGPVAKIGVDGNGNVYVGGAFETAGGISVQNIARWNNGWSALTDSGTSGTGTNNEIRSIAFDNANVLYVGGNFDTAGGRNANRIATWNGTNWGTLGEGTSGFVQAIEVTSEYIYAGGTFGSAGGNTVNNLARWNRNSNQWQLLGDGVNGSVNSLEHDGTYLYVGGSFETAGQDSSTDYIVNNSARWSSGGGWQALGPARAVGTDNIVRALALSDDNRLYTGGTFDNAANVTADNLAVWALSFDCGDERLITEYRINGEWSSGDTEITLPEGTDLILSLLPNTVTFSITLPNGNITEGDYGLGEITKEDEGTYVFVTEGQCQISLILTVETEDEPCTSESVVPEFRIGNNGWISGEESTTVDEGTPLALRVAPGNLDFTVTLPNGTEQEVSGLLDLGAVTPGQQGTYLFTIAEGCSASFEISVIANTPNCPEGSIVPEYTVNGETGSGQTEITVDQGAEVLLGTVDNQDGLLIRLPNGTTVSGSYQTTNITSEQEGTYTFISQDSCEATLTINVEETGTGDSCNIVPEYRLNRVWYSGESNITVDQGTDIILSILPNDVPLTITLPNGTVVNDNYSLGLVTPEDNGTYLFTASDGCTAELNLIVETLDCGGVLIPEYRINGNWLSGDNVVTVNESAEVILSMLPNGVGLNITRPNGQVVGDNYRITNFTSADSGTYVLTSEEGCTETLELRAIDGCEEAITPEYRINGQWSSGQENLSIVVGTNLMLSMLPNDIGLTITKPDGTVVGDNYSIGQASLSDSGRYTLRSENGCTRTFNLSVDEIPNCDANALVAEYRVAGVWRSGQNALTVDRGEEVVLSALPNDKRVTITLPNGEVVGDNYSLGNVGAQDAGFYVIESAEGCRSVLQLYVSDSASNRNDTFDEFGREFENSARENTSVSVYPNPTSTMVTVDLYGLAGKEVEVVVTNMQQQQLLYRALKQDHSPTLDLSLETLTTGTYFVSVWSNGAVITKKVVKR
ncbi:PQQ-dependent sugar dehydrogenase [Maribacter sp. 2-571]|uniref:PQQ-dependent sugar dehydrogenase n=1 Tax=Maribacter sp. 2-571 TaxID=3417569 RepID=UPI003D3419DD